MKTNHVSFLAAGVTTLGLLAVLTGCANVPMAQSTSESAFAPAYWAATANPGVDLPVPVRKVQPSYPYELRRAGVTGVVNLTAIVDENGRVRDAKVIDSSADAFSQPALEALRQWTFEPARRDGRPIAVRVNLPIQFNLRED